MDALLFQLPCHRARGARETEKISINEDNKCGDLFCFFFKCRFCFSFSLECTYFRPALYLSKIHSIFRIPSDVTNEIINNGAHSGKNEEIRGLRDDNIEFIRSFSQAKKKFKKIKVKT